MSNSLLMLKMLKIGPCLCPFFIDRSIDKFFFTLNRITFSYSCERLEMAARWPLLRQKDAGQPNCSFLLDPTAHATAGCWVWSRSLKDVLEEKKGGGGGQTTAQTHIQTNTRLLSGSKPQQKAKPLPAFLKVRWRLECVSFSSFRITRLSLFTLWNRVAKYSRTTQATVTMTFLRIPTKKAMRSCMIVGMLRFIINKLFIHYIY